MQEEVEMKTVGLVVECVKMTDRILRDAVKAYLRMESPAKEKGKVTSLGKAKKSNIKLSETFLSEKDIGEAEKAAEKNGVEITVKDVKGDDGKKIILLRFDDPGKLGKLRFVRHFPHYQKICDLLEAEGVAERGYEILDAVSAVPQFAVARHFLTADDL